ncbi:Helix-turn-helix domain protein [Pelotomaculum schinkii]|uniref:Helix-turn-helix domain protein n=1 Tax=Pelotomaculum schinkii TaxID=78350 RepID=A0A4Y7R930_9FIRM|nr:helix-turn-helix transcriptional regulator [Pelotomaculum schinkii]TEB05465.1 Helix-turn-helix domain protein [Pelotomaculum schinkii]
MITNIKHKDVCKYIPVESLISKNFFTPNTVDIGKEKVLLYIPKLPVNINFEFDYIHKEGKTNQEDALKTYQRVLEAKKIITSKLINEWVTLFYNNDPLSKQIAWLITPKLLNVYLLHLNNSIKEKGLKNAITERPYIEITTNEERDYITGLKEEYFNTVFISVEAFLQKSLREVKYIWREFANWFLTNLIVMALEWLESNFGKEALDSMNKEQRVQILNNYLYNDALVFSGRYRYLVGMYVQDLSRSIVKSIDLTNPSMEELEIILGLKALEGKNQDVKISFHIDRSMESPFSGSLLGVGNCLLYYRFREVLAISGFTIPEGESWPTANLTTGNRKLRAIVQLRPDPVDIEPYLSNTEIIAWQKRMRQNVMSMDDVTADVVDIVSAIWLKQASHYEDIATVTADDILAFRGLKPQKNGAGRRGGYKNVWRQEIARHIAILANTWIVVAEMDVTEEVEGKKGRQRKRVKWQGESKAWVVDSKSGQGTMEGKDSYVWRVRPGDVFSKFLFGAGRQTALISQKAVEYHPINQQWEKRLTRYLTWQWRNRQGGGAYLAPFNVETLLNAVNKEVSKHNPSQTKERLEKALDILQQDHIITGWQYECVNEDIVGTKGWWKEWLVWKVIIEPPQEIMDHYGKIRDHKIKRREAQPTPCQERTATFMGPIVKKARLQSGLSQMQAAEEIGVDQSTMSRLERGKSTDGRTRYLLKKWLEDR